MPLTSFPNGVSSFGVPLVGSGPIVTTGNVFFVHSGTGVNSTSYGTDKDRPFASIDYAVGFCTASKGDVILAMPGHTETVTAAGGLDLDVAGIRVIALGSGPSRATINVTTAATADIDIDAAGITLENFLITGGVDDVTALIDVNAADFKLLNCEYRDVTGQVAIFLTADANADRLLIDGLFYNGAAAAGTTQAVQLVGCDNPVIRNSTFIGNFSTSCINCATTAVVDLEIYNCYIWTKNAADIAIKDTVTGSTGRCGPGLYFMLTDNAANITESITGATFHQFGDIMVCNLAGEIGMAINTTASTDA